MRHRGEFCERSFVHVLDYGGARRTTLRGRENILKRYLVQAACLNLSILLRETLGIGTLKQTWTASTAALTTLELLIRALLRPIVRWRASDPCAARCDLDFQLLIAAG
jgi:transposase